MPREQMQEFFFLLYKKMISNADESKDPLNVRLMLVKAAAEAYGASQYIYASILLSNK